MPRDRDQEKDTVIRKRKSLLSRTWSGIKWIWSIPGRTFPTEEVVASGRMIARLVEAARGGRSDPLFRTYDDRRFDLEAIAFLRGMEVWQVEALLRRRQRQTAIAAYIFFGLGWAVFLFWLFKIATTPWSSWRIVPVLEFAPFCLFLFLVAFKSTLQNYQLRTRRLATAWEYLSTSERFWPT